LGRALAKGKHNQQKKTSNQGERGGKEEKLATDYQGSNSEQKTTMPDQVEKEKKRKRGGGCEKGRGEGGGGENLLPWGVCVGGAPVFGNEKKEKVTVTPKNNLEKLIPIENSQPGV